MGFHTTGSAAAGGIPEPSTDGTIYGRDGAVPAWTEVLPIGGGALSIRRPG